MGLGLLIISLLAATLIAKEANRTVLVWATKSELAPGELITDNDITPVSALLPESAKNYLSASAQIIGSVLVILDNTQILPTLQLLSDSRIIIVRSI